MVIYNSVAYARYGGVHMDKKEIDFNDLISREKDLKKIEHKVSNNIISVAFPEIKFKKYAQIELIKLMKKYPIRKLFETCALITNNKFSIPEIKIKCNEKNRG